MQSHRLLGGGGDGGGLGGGGEGGGGLGGGGPSTSPNLASMVVG